jgi:hypothetical protein
MTSKLQLIKLRTSSIGRRFAGQARELLRTAGAEEQSLYFRVGKQIRGIMQRAAIMQLLPSTHATAG